MAQLSKFTPLMKQYFEIREQYPDSILLFQVGDFYELFFDDAKKASSYLAIALTRRGKHNGEDIPLCGVPVHALNHYLLKLINGGFKVALCDQLSKPEPGKVVKRGVTKVFTPGTLTEESMLDDKSASYILSFYPEKKYWGLVFTEILTAQMFATYVNLDSMSLDSFRMVEAELIRFHPDEIIIPGDKSFKKFDNYFKKQGHNVSSVNNLDNNLEEVDLWLEKQFDSNVLKILSNSLAIKSSLSLMYSYMKKNQSKVLENLKNISFYKPEDYLILDSSTQKNLEIINNLKDRGRKNTLFSVLDKSATSMGSRIIKKWLQRPLISKSKILQRQEVILAISKNIELMQKLSKLLGEISDLERIVGRIGLERALLSDYLALKKSLKIVPEIRKLLQKYLLFYLTDVVQAKLLNFDNLFELLDCSLNCDFSDKSIIKRGFDIELDRLKLLVNNSQKEILNLEKEEIEKTGISSLKIRFNNIAGYYIEVTKPNLKLVTERYIHQQTLVNRSRYVTTELKDLQRDILRAQSETEVIENKAFEKVKIEVEEQLVKLRDLAQALSYLDGLFGLALAAYENNYVQPEFNDSRDIIIKDGRHPVVDLSCDNSFIPNSTSLTDEESVVILTGPNMGGKSTYLRQVALICIMAQAGSLIPVKYASLPIIDRIFTRIGSADNLAEGKSTFLVEMEETAIICSQATRNSLVILDEVGRGTSTSDGIAIAQAIIEYIVQKIGARSLFATHYHELTDLKNKFSSIENYHVESKQSDSGILFLHKVSKGIARGSFGLEVAKLAGLSDVIIKRSHEILKNNGNKHKKEVFCDSEILQKIAVLESELERSNSICKDIKSVDIDNISPRQAFEILCRLKESL